MQREFDSMGGFLMPRIKNLTGQKFGKLTVICRDYGHQKGKGTFWKCRCDCGNELIVSAASLTSKNTRSCGCLQREAARRVGYKNAKKNKYILLNKQDAYIEDVRGNRSLINISDIPLVKDSYWSLSGNGYFSRNSGTDESITIHRFITGCPDGLVVDHINHNKLDNRRENLRVCSQFENMCNSKEKGKIVGVNRNNTNGKRMASVDAQGFKKRKQFNSKEEAIKQRAEWERMIIIDVYEKRSNRVLT